MSLNESLRRAKRQGNDEFCTQRSDIEKELRHYTRHFRGKVVYYNCDDPRISSFFHYFSYNFERLGLKKLVTACYRNQERDLFSRHDSERAIWLEYAGNAKGDRVSDVRDIGVREFEGDGDFRSAECVELLTQADIVVTNPPFSLFREYVAQLVQYGRKFLIVGSRNAITYKEIFPLIKDNRMWLGVTPKGQDMLFDVPEGYAQELVATGKEGSAHRVVEGVVKGRLGNAAWFTNLDHEKRHEKLILYKRYSPEEYPTYDNYDAINVDRIADIPTDWNGVMGVPITFLDKWNPEQFEILGVSYLWDDGFESHTFHSETASGTAGRPSGWWGARQAQALSPGSPDSSHPRIRRSISARRSPRSRSIVAWTMRPTSRPTRRCSSTSSRLVRGTRTMTSPAIVGTCPFARGPSCGGSLPAARSRTAWRSMRRYIATPLSVVASRSPACTVIGPWETCAS